MKPITIVVSLDNLRPQMGKVWEVVKTYVTGGPVEILIRDVKKSRLMEKKYHAMFRDIAGQVEVEGRQYGADIWKRLLVDQFEMEINNQGQKLSHPSRTVISLDGKRAVTMSASTTEFRKGEAGDFIAFLYAWGVEHNVTWSEPYLDFYEQYKARW